MTTSSSSAVIPVDILNDIASATGVTEVVVGDTLQSLWSGYGGIIHLILKKDETQTQSAILKLISPPEQVNHPRGWNTDLSRQRKIKSYEVESLWYESYSSQCHELCHVPTVLATGEYDASRWILLEDLNSNYPVRAMDLSIDEASVCLRWLAAFHAQFLFEKPTGLWPIGTYWHLATRSDELAAMAPGQLKDKASALDKALNDCEFQTFVHGDAKVANFCFSENFTQVAAVDFQYVGGGVGIKDVVYFLGSCIDEASLETQQNTLLALYFDALHESITHKHDAKLADAVVQAWSDLYAIAWTDFYRFLTGWSPGHQKINSYTQKLAEQALAQLP